MLGKQLKSPAVQEDPYSIAVSFQARECNGQFQYLTVKTPGRS